MSKRFGLLRAGGVRLVVATWPNNDAEANGSQGLNLEKVKNLYRTATMKKIMLVHARARDGAARVTRA
jgi:hypothetical protein